VDPEVIFFYLDHSKMHDWLISASEVTTLLRYTDLFIINTIIFTPVLNSQGMKK